jgi:hypothetical protein
VYGFSPGPARGGKNPGKKSGYFIFTGSKNWSGIIMTEGTPLHQQLFEYEHDAGRLELLIRIVYWILIAIVLWVYGIIACICLIVQWLHILVLGRRNEALSNLVQGYLEYMIHVLPYTYFMTDKRPDIMPVAVKIFEEA